MLWNVWLRKSPRRRRQGYKGKKHNSIIIEHFEKRINTVIVKIMIIIIIIVRTKLVLLNV